MSFIDGVKEGFFRCFQCKKLIEDYDKCSVQDSRGDWYEVCPECMRNDTIRNRQVPKDQVTLGGW